MNGSIPTIEESNKKVLIIGGLGFIGSHLVKKCLAKGYAVTIFSRAGKTDNIEEVKDKVKLITKDLKDIDEEVKGFDFIFNLAGSVDNYAIIDNQPYRDIEANCITAIALLEACRKHNPTVRLIFASSFFVNGNVKDLPVTAESPCNPLGLYPATKLAAEHFFKIYHNVFGLDIVIARFTNVFGTFEQANNKKKAGFNYLINLALKGQDIPLYNNGDFFRDYIFVEDVADACIVLAEKGETNKIYYVGRGEFIKFKKLIDIVAGETGVGITPIEPPQFHKNVGITNFVADVTDLKELGWQPKFSLEEGIKKTIQYYKNINQQN